MDKVDKAAVMAIKNENTVSNIVDNLLGEETGKIKSAEDIKSYEDKFKKTAQISGKIADALEKFGGEDAWEVQDGVYNTNPLGYGDIIDFNKEELRTYEDTVIGGFDSEDAQEVFDSIINTNTTGVTAAIVIFTKDEDVWVELDIEAALKGIIDGLVVAKKGETSVSSVEEIVNAVEGYIDTTSKE